MGKIILLLILVTPISTRKSSARIYQDLETVSLQYYFDGFEFFRTVNYALSGIKLSCVKVTGDGSRFFEMFVADLHKLDIPPREVLNHHSQPSHACNVTLVAAETGENLYNVLLNQRFWASARFYCIVANSSLSSLRDMFENRAEMFLGAEVVLFVYQHYSKGWKIIPPDHNVELLKLPTFDKWFTKGRHTSQQEIRFTTANCSIFGTVKNVSNPDPYTPGDIGGLDFRLLKDFARKMNYTMVYVPTTEGSIYLGEYYNGSWNGGMLGGLVDNTVDVVICGLWVDWRLLGGGIKMTYPQRKVCTLYLVPRPTPISETFMAFSPAFYAMMSVAIITITFTLNAVNLPLGKCFIPSNHEAYKSWKFCFMVIWGILLQSSYPSRSTDLGSGKRILLLWVIFSMIITVWFSSHMVSNYTNPILTPKPADVEDLVDMGYHSPYFSLNPVEEDELKDTSSGIFSGIFDPEDPLGKEWLRRSHPMGFEELVQTLRTKPQQALFGYLFVHLDRPSFVPGFTLRPIPADVLALYEPMDNCVRTTYTSIAVRHGSNLFGKLNKFLSVSKEFGFVEKGLINDLEDLASRYPALREISWKTSSLGESKALSMHELREVFLVLRFGLITAFVVFLTELCVYKIGKLMNNFDTCSVRNYIP